MIPFRILSTAFAGGGAAAALVAAGWGALPPACASDAVGAGAESAEVRCSCFREPDLDKQVAAYFKNAEVVLEVLVISVDTLGGPLPDTPPPSGLNVREFLHPLVARLQIEETWKGDAVESATLHMTDAWVGGTSCDMILRTGERHLLFARVDKDTGYLKTHSCSGTSTLERAEREGVLRRVEALAITDR